MTHLTANLTPATPSRVGVTGAAGEVPLPMLRTMHRPSGPAGGLSSDLASNFLEMRRVGFHYSVINRDATVGSSSAFDECHLLNAQVPVSISGTAAAGRLAQRDQPRTAGRP